MKYNLTLLVTSLTLRRRPLRKLSSPRAEGGFTSERVFASIDFTEVKSEVAYSMCISFA